MKSNQDNKHHKLSVFISYASEDLAHATNIATILRSKGFDPWIDKKQILPGHDWRLEINNAVKNSDAIVICLSKLSINKSGYVQKELKLALDVSEEQPEDSIYLIPVRLEPCIVPRQLSSINWVDIYDPSGMDYLVEALRIRARELKCTVIPEDLKDQLVGEYFVSGNNPSGTTYSGSVIISAQGESYLLTWYVGGKHFEARGIRDKNKLYVTGTFNFYYQINGEKELHGCWELDSFEYLIKK